MVGYGLCGNGLDGIKPFQRLARSRGSNPLAESRKYEKKYGSETAGFVMDTRYHHYHRLTMVARNQKELETYRPRAKEVAVYCARWGMRYEELLGTDHYLQRLVEIAIGLEQKGDEFLLIPPVGTLTHAHFIR